MASVKCPIWARPMECKMGVGDYTIISGCPVPASLSLNNRSAKWICVEFCRIQYHRHWSNEPVCPRQRSSVIEVAGGGVIAAAVENVSLLRKTLF